MLEGRRTGKPDPNKGTADPGVSLRSPDARTRGFLLFAVRGFDVDLFENNSCGFLQEEHLGAYPPGEVGAAAACLTPLGSPSALSPGAEMSGASR